MSSMQFSLIHPKAAPDLQEQPLENSNSAASKIRTLPKSIQPPPAAETCKGMLILAKSGLRNRGMLCLQKILRLSLLQLSQPPPPNC
ncbi:hypothetical protein OS493_023746 [Desmophyllum pertusum]|uniref:Uncharacterized protein n=1 Tax=Desmophyllum pertusum TaxID=174260 RepID=A0A9X0CSD3_9CNID|nr:hypothetical protein OS493_023746 [Desmophyllum pertusum]